MKKMQPYVVGFLFRDEGKEVALVRKNRPLWQAGRLNGIGGKIEEGEEPIDAMIREFKEEAGAKVKDWKPFATMFGDDWIVSVFVSHAYAEIQPLTDEHVGWYRAADIPTLHTVENLKWLVPMALVNDSFYATVSYDG